MTKKELSQLYRLNREIEKDKRLLETLEAAATSTTPRLTGLPHAPGKADKTALAAEIADLRAIIDAKVQLTIVEYNRIHRYAAAIEDSLTRQIVILRHVNGLTWKQVAAHIGGSNTEASVKMAYHRHFTK